MTYRAGMSPLPSPAPRGGPARPRGRPLCSWRAVLALVPALALLGCPSREAGPRPVTGVEAPRPRAISPSPALVELVYAIGAGPHLVGVSRFCSEPEAARALPRVGGMIDPNLEAVDALAPDLLLVQGRNEALNELARRRDFAVHTFELETLADVNAALRRLGALFGREEQAAQEAARLERALAGARAQAPPDPPRTLIVFGHRAGELGQVSCPGPGTFVAECLRAAGGVGVVDDLAPRSWHVVSKEALFERAPELIIELHPDPVDGETAEALRADWSGLEGIPAVASGRIAIVSGSDVLIPGPRLDRLVGKLARAVRGERDLR